MSTGNVKTKTEKRYNFYTENHEIYLENETNEKFIQDVRLSGEPEDSIFYRIPVELLEKIQIRSQIVTIK